MSEAPVSCYGCGAAGVFRSNCTCKATESPPKPVAFYTLQTSIKDHVKIPTIEISVKGKNGYAYIEAGNPSQVTIPVSTLSHELFGLRAFTLAKAVA